MENVRTVFRMLHQELYVLSSEQKRKSLFLFCLFLGGSFIQMIGVTAILPFIEALMNTEEFRSRWYIARFVDIFHLESDLSLVLFTATVIVLIYFTKNFYLLWAFNIQQKYRYKFQKELSVRMLRTIMKRPYEYFLNVNSSEILRMINGDVIGVYGVYEFGFNLIAEILNIAMIGVLLIYQDWIMAIGVLLVTGLCFIVTTVVFRIMLKGAGEKQRKAAIILSKYSLQIANGIKEINVMKRNDFFVGKYDDAYYKCSQIDKKYAFIEVCPPVILETSCVIGLLSIVCMRIAMGVEAAEFVPQLSVFALAAFRILPSISKMVGYITGLIYQRPNLESAYNNIIEVENYEKEMSEYVAAHSHNDSDPTVRFMESLRIDKVCWTYPKSDKQVLKDLSITIKKGESVGLIGPSGAGKTTLSDIILGLFKPQSGSVFMDGIDIYTIPGEWSSIIGYVPQSVYLTDDTIKNNIGFGTDENEIDDERVWHALEQAQLKDYVMSLPDKLETFVGERGIRFSGGQRQRIAIARALYYNPDILVLDEATSALDNETEKAIMESIDSLQRHKTLIIVAHRLTTLRNCDKIYEIKDGIAKEVNKKEVGIDG